MARKKKKTPEDTSPETETVEGAVEDVVEQSDVDATPVTQTDWRWWGAPGITVGTGANVTLPPDVPLQVLEMGKDTAVVRHPHTGVEVVVRRGMLALR
jgi:hypothetical protein